ncbi:lipopolysaccharide biosynthesis protein [Muricauda sp. CAU 1633]|uniref:lipopolysaccharide biosynthesis protein n=1 Tax=Allomuricauda sp. CAU 1633 TaxID=2816036 RepID=UPI001A8C71DD|nr:lipopolysaccharide biosynthesis protein [Muricauda sp. CAU 1633]MBO0323562.1 lipopolysaccharide biosynthesis protein [Muricauda sp. CAU 1633]
MGPSKNDSLTKKGIKGFIWNFSGSVVQIVLQLLVIGILSRLLTPEEFGVVAIIMIVVNFTRQITRMGIASSLIQLPVITDKHIALGYTSSIVLGTLLGFVYYLLTPLFADFFNIQKDLDALQFFSIFFPLVSFGSVGEALLSRKFRFDVGVKIGLIAYLIGSGIVSVAMAFLGFGYWSLIWGQFITLCFTIILTIYYEVPKFSLRWEKQPLKDLFFFGSGHTLGIIFNFFGEKADNIVVGKILGTALLGFYSKAFQLYSIPASFFGTIFDKVLFPILSQKQNDIKKLSSFYTFSTTLCFGLLIPISVLILINSELIIDAFLGNQWKSAVLPLQLLILGLSFRFGTRINKSYLKSLGIVYRGAYYQLIFALLMFVCTYVGGQLYSLPGVAAGVLVATVINYVQIAYRLYKLLDFSGIGLIKDLSKNIMFHFIFVLATMLLYYFGITSKWIHLAITVIVYLPIFVLYFKSKKNIVFTPNNRPMFITVSNSLPGKIKNYMGRVPIFKDFFAQHS